MNTKQKITLAACAAALVLAAFLIGSMVSERRIGKLGDEAKAAARTAEMLKADAAEKEKNANEYKAKIEYLELHIAGLRTIAARQEQEAKLLEKDVAAARTDVRSAARVRAVTSTAAELCGKLAELGHRCGD